LLNRRGGQIAIGLLSGLALAFALAALFAMVSFKGGLETKSEELSRLMYNIDFNKKYVLAETKLLVNETIEGCGYCKDSEQLTIALNKKAGEKERFASVDDAGNLFGRLRNIQDFYLIVNPQGDYELHIEDVFVTAQIENNKVTRRFDICQTFDVQGNFLKDCEIQAI